MILSKRKSSVNAKRNIIANTYPDSIISEQFRMIQTNIKFSVADQKNRIFLITSPGTGEGKSTSAANLAVSMAQQKKKVLLIDANLRNPVLHTIFNIPNSDGLTDVLKGRITFEEAVCHTEIGRLDVLASGINLVNPVELLGSQLMRDLLKVALQRYDIVLIDSYSVIDVTDTKLLANQSDGVILVIQSGKTLLEKAAEAKKEIEFAKSKVVGVILNEN
ncbi:CpsD/CapB family tyrosine-protein kinase [Bacillus sp. EB600]|uniref:CpsD/CapB family tyrosine-protein kinase n=1 Tax=Bacillus sp. EB600 TaxID=2806345 RepID=UPI0021097064|nr:CpsD/CapB family tyrosine-protein kinase [Bacillus sp. EB600]MCQ6278905.1 CpsD/CapB family tyrosine-protein kinase [Bacillus sp. EB600]